MLPPVNPADWGAVSNQTGSLSRGRHGPGAGHLPGLAESDPVRRSRQARTKILDTLVDISRDAASDAGSTPAASTKLHPVAGGSGLLDAARTLLIGGDPRANPLTFGRVPDLNHLWQRFLLAASLLVGLAVGVAVTVFGYSNLTSVDVHWSVFHLSGVPLWAVVVVPIALILVAGTVYHWMNGLHHFTEHMRHRHRVHELEGEVARLKSHLDQILEMPRHEAIELPAKKGGRASLPAADVDAADEVMSSLEPSTFEAATSREEPAWAESSESRIGSGKQAGDRRKRARLVMDPEPKSASEAGPVNTNGADSGAKLPAQDA